nr:CPBP family intramembrane glutamic endopeptidase [Bacillus piscicola]
MVFKKYGIVTIAFGAGVSEELLFRGALQGVLTVYIGSVPALLLIAGVFMILHIPQYKGSAFIHTLVFVMGLILGGLFIWSGSLWAPIAAHVTYNGCLAYILKKKRPQHKLPSYAAVCMRLSS